MKASAGEKYFNKSVFAAKQKIIELCGMDKCNEVSSLLGSLIEDCQLVGAYEAHLSLIDNCQCYNCNFIKEETK